LHTRTLQLHYLPDRQKRKTRRKEELKAKEGFIRTVLEAVRF